ncbi:MAG TPA: polyhydroxyalkanoic acid system family protein [Pirellulaceae bacterium]|jgi:hypothetical protein|nr:polyhydroxyalkanoic acid system family protein [Pirellulaceae bacterium]
MPGFDVTVPNPMGQEKAIERLHSLSDGMKKRFEGQIKDWTETWSGNAMDFSFKTLGSTIKGKLTVDESSARINGDLPFMAMAFKGQIEKSIKEEMSKALA